MSLFWACATAPPRKSNSKVVVVLGLFTTAVMGSIGIVVRLSGLVF